MNEILLMIGDLPVRVSDALIGLGVLALILLMYLVLGCLMDAMAMVILTVPIVFPVVTALGFDRGVVVRVLQMVKHNEYKRRQAPPGIRISSRAFGRDWRYPITSWYPFPG